MTLAIFDLDQDGSRIGEDEKKYHDERDALLQELGKIAGDLQRHEQESASFKDFLVDFEN